MNNNYAIAECIEFPNRINPNKMNPIECIQCPNIINMNADIESNQLNVLYNVVICSYKNFLNQPSNMYLHVHI
jgi:hypothetical protein